MTQTLVRPFLVIVVNKFSDGRPKVPFAERDHSRQALGSDRADKSLGKGVKFGLRDGNRTTLTPLFWSRLRKAAV